MKTDILMQASQQSDDVIPIRKMHCHQVTVLNHTKCILASTHPGAPVCWKPCCSSRSRRPRRPPDTSRTRLGSTWPSPLLLLCAARCDCSAPHACRATATCRSSTGATRSPVPRRLHISATSCGGDCMRVSKRWNRHKLIAGDNQGVLPCPVRLVQQQPESNNESVDKRITKVSGNQHRIFARGVQKGNLQMAVLAVQLQASLITLKPPTVRRSRNTFMTRWF